jgi:hypothetical protein
MWGRGDRADATQLSRRQGADTDQDKLLSRTCCAVALI